MSYCSICGKFWKSGHRCRPEAIRQIDREYDEEERQSEDEDEQRPTFVERLETGFQGREGN